MRIEKKAFKHQKYIIDVWSGDHSESVEFQDKEKALIFEKLVDIEKKLGEDKTTNELSKDEEELLNKLLKKKGDKN